MHFPQFIYINTVKFTPNLKNKGLVIIEVYVLIFPINHIINPKSIMHFTIYYNQITHTKVISGLHFGLPMHVGYECFEIGSLNLVSK